MACIRLCPFIGLSRYIVCMLGQSKPVSHMSRTMTSFKPSDGALNRLAMASLASFVRMCGCHAVLSDAEPLMTILIWPLASSALCHCGRSLMIASYISTQMRRDMQTIIALPSIASSRFSKWSMMSCATRRTRFSVPTIASSAAHLVLSLFFSASSSPSVISSNSGSSFGFSSSFSSSLASRDS